MAHHSILVCGLDAKGHFFAEEDVTENVSASGCCFRAASQPMPDTVVSIKPRNSAGAGEACAGLYQVIWTREESGALLIGSSKIQFEQP